MTTIYVVKGNNCTSCKAVFTCPVKANDCKNRLDEESKINAFVDANINDVINMIKTSPMCVTMIQMHFKNGLENFSHPSSHQVQTVEA